MATRQAIRLSWDTGLFFGNLLGDVEFEGNNNGCSAVTVLRGVGASEDSKMYCLAVTRL